MSFVRPEIAAALRRWREAWAGAALATLGLWWLITGGLLLATIGALAAAAGAALAFTAWRRLRFAQDVAAPGIVEVDEGRISYFGPHAGGAVALSELTEIAIVRTAEGHRAWRLTQPDRVLEIPVAAAGADRLFDVFAALPGASATALLAALEAPPVAQRRIWARASTEPRLPRP